MGLFSALIERIKGVTAMSEEPTVQDASTPEIAIEATPDAPILGYDGTPPCVSCQNEDNQMASPPTSDFALTQLQSLESEIAALKTRLIGKFDPVKTLLQGEEAKADADLTTLKSLQ